MKLRVLGCSGGSTAGDLVASYLFNDDLVVDAGGMTGGLDLSEQEKIRYIVLSHSHLDHHCGLPFFADNVFGRLAEPVRVYATEPVLDSLRRHIFNDVIWPNFTQLPSPEKPTLQFHPMSEAETLELGGMKVTPIRVHHLTPTVGFVIGDKKSSIIYTSDTGPTDQVWARANQDPNVRALVTEVSFSSDSEELANASGHMTPKLLQRELEKLTVELPIYLTHLKPAHRERILEELESMDLPRVKLLEQGKTYIF